MSTKPARLTLITLILTIALLLSALPDAASAGTDLLQDEPPTATPAPTIRPILLIESFSTNPTPVSPGQNFNLSLLVRNAAAVPDPAAGLNPQQGYAYNMVITFEPGDILPSGSGGMLTLPEQADFDPGTTARLEQTFQASSSLAGQSHANLVATISYTDYLGTPFSSSFTLGIAIAKPAAPSGPPRPTATPTQLVILRPQLVISGYKTDAELLQPGTAFKLTLDVHNLGNADARGVTMIMGGGSITPGQEGTPQPGGVSGSTGEFTNFAPLESSNIQFLGNIPTGESVDGLQPLIVNVSTNPGAYSVKFSFVYVDEKGNRYLDDQVITLLVYSLPQVELSFYRDPGVFMLGQPNMLPLQVVNLGRKSTVLGNMRAAAAGGQVMNNIAFVGPLEPGNYFTLDPTFIPEQAGPVDIEVTVNYTDDFNQPRSISQVLTVNVEDMPVIEPGGEGFPNGPGGEGPFEPPPAAPETFWQKVVRFFRGLVGLDSGIPEPSFNEGPMGPGEGPIEGPINGPIKGP